jgi:hypothetical protein
MNERYRRHDGYVAEGYSAGYDARGSRVAERMYCPGSEHGAGETGSERGVRPSLDEHLVEPETRWEVHQGSRVQASPARSPHADRHFTIDYVLGAHLAPGYVGATDLLTRWSSDDDYATDTSVRRAGIDVTTGERRLEELAFEVVYQQRRRELEVRARSLSERGVRRIFAVFVKEGTVEEWVPMTGTWRALESGSVIADRCLSEPIAVRALLDAAAADECVARTLVARRHPVIEQFGQSQKIEAKIEWLRLILAERGLEPNAQQRARMEACNDPGVLADWLRRALVATHADAVFLGRAGAQS